MAIRDEMGYTVQEYNVGTWNMDTTVTQTVAHSLSATEIDNIVEMWCMIRPVPGTTVTPLTTMNSSGTHGGGIGQVQPTQFLLNRLTGGFFDSAAYNAAEGKLYVKYIAD